jgi:hypothetical protein
VDGDRLQRRCRGPDRFRHLEGGDPQGDGLRPEVGDEAREVEVQPGLVSLDPRRLEDLSHEAVALGAHRVEHPGGLLPVTVRTAELHLQLGHPPPQLDLALGSGGQIDAQGVRLRPEGRRICLKRLRACLEIDNLFEGTPQECLCPSIAHRLSSVQA